MCQVAGEVADGIRAHPVCTPRYIAEVMLPAARKGAAKTGRDFAGFAMAAMPLIATAPDRAGAADARVRDVRARIAFYASTPAYLIAFETEGYGEVARDLATAIRGRSAGRRCRLSSTTRCSIPMP